MRRHGLEIRIDRIDLSAMPSDGERRLREALERELSRLALNHAPEQGRPSQHEGADRLGARIAGGVQGAMPRGGRR